MHWAWFFFFFQEMVSLDQLNVMQNMKINIGYSSLFSIAVGMDDKVHWAYNFTTVLDMEEK